MNESVIIHGGCVTVHAEAGKAHDITFTNGAQGTLLTVTADGALVPGEGLASDDVTRQVAGMLVDSWGRSYGQRLRKADKDARKAESELENWKVRAEKAEAKIKAVERAIERAPARAKPLKEKIVPVEPADEDQDQA